MSGSPVILAIETSQRGGGVAVRDAAGIDHAEPLRAERRHDDDLLPAIDRLLGRTGIDRHDLDAVALSIGPGGFTGLRIAVSTVKMMALALECAVIAVPTAVVVAEGSIAPESPEGTRAVVALATKRETVWITHLKRRGARWMISDQGLEAVAQLVIAGDVVIVADAHQPESLQERAVAARYDALACLREAAHRFSDGERADPVALAPHYPRPPEAVSLWAARHG